MPTTCSSPAGTQRNRAGSVTWLLAESGSLHVTWKIPMPAPSMCRSMPARNVKEARTRPQPGDLSIWSHSLSLALYPQMPGSFLSDIDGSAGSKRNTSLNRMQKNRAAYLRDGEPCPHGKGLLCGSIMAQKRGCLSLHLPVHTCGI